MHLAIDGYGGDSRKMWDAQLVRDFLFRCPDTLRMTRITEPEESHISIHTFPFRQYVNIDMFSCRPFDEQLALAEAKELFGLERVQSWLLERGLEWLDSRDGAAEVEQQRAGLQAGTLDRPSG